MSVCGSGRLNIDLIYEGLNNLPSLGEEVYSKAFSVNLGGGTPGTLINLARLNIPVKLLTYIGNDMFSNFAKDELEKHSVSYINLNNGSDSFPINISSAVLTPNERTFISYGSPEFETESDAKLLYDMGLKAGFVIMELNKYKNTYKKLKEKGVKLFLDPGYTKDMNLKTYGEFLKLSDYYLPNRKEALQITQTDTVEDAAKVLSNYLETVIIKLDKDGTYLYKNGKGKVIDSYKNFTHVDSTGAGDAFLAGFIYGIYNKMPIEKSIMCGNLTGGKCVTAVGCLTAYLTENELLKFLVEN